MKLNKKRISILLSLLCLMFLLVFTLCSFGLPQYSSTSSIFDGISLDDAYYLMSIVSMQEQTGQFNNFVFMCAGYYENTGQITAYFANKGGVFSISIVGYQVRVSGSATVFSATYNDTGFTYLTSSSMGSISFSYQNFICYRSNKDTSVQLNSYFTSSSDTNSASIYSTYLYWNQFLNRLISSGPSSDELESAYDSGFADGYDSGYVDGFDTGFSYGEQFGYQDGYSDGIGTGYDQGYLAGEADGYDTGYSDGYLDGYETGYDSGYSEAERETVIEYVEPVELDVPSIFNSITSIPNNILQGSFDFDFFGINLYGLLKIIILLFIVSAVVVFIIKRSK